MKKYVIYHASCLDGFASAYVFWLKYKNENIEFIPAHYGDAVPNIEDSAIYMVDFSYKKDTVLQLMLQGNIVWHIDHHKTAITELIDVPNLQRWCDVEQSGCALAWSFVFPDAPLPPLLKRIQDRDLWRFEYMDTKAICAGLYLKKWDFNLWHTYMYEMEELAEIGGIIIDMDNVEIERIIKREIPIVVDGEIVIGYSCPPKYISEVGNRASIDKPYSISYYDIAEKRVYSLRSNKNNPEAVDVSEIASKFGGGGHKHAAGFSVPMKMTALVSAEFNTIKGV
jgi:oligoribonuclease NrnB/cAMP/cGMP phosphodiesterase (DHH superfamily)